MIELCDDRRPAGRNGASSRQGLTEQPRCRRIEHRLPCRLINARDLRRTLLRSSQQRRSSQRQRKRNDLDAPTSRHVRTLARMVRPFDVSRDEPAGGIHDQHQDSPPRIHAGTARRKDGHRRQGRSFQKLPPHPVLRHTPEIQKTILRRNPTDAREVPRIRLMRRKHPHALTHPEEWHRTDPGSAKHHARHMRPHNRRSHRQRLRIDRNGALGRSARPGPDKLPAGR